MSTINGCGTKMLLEFDEQDDGSYFTIKFIVLFFIPLIPIATYQIFEADEGHPPSLPFGSSTSTYRLRKVKMNWKVAWRLLRIIYLIILICAGLIIMMKYYGSNLLTLFLGIMGIFAAAVGGLIYIVHQYEK